MHGLSSARALACLLGVALAAGCAQHSTAPSQQAQLLTREAAGIATPRYDEDFVEARLIYQALPVGSPDRTRLREKLFDYLLQPLESLRADQLRLSVNGPFGTDDLDRAQSALREAIGLLSPEELWSEGTGLGARERARLVRAAELVRLLYAPRGNEGEALLALGVLATLAADPTAWNARIEEILSWVAEGGQVAPALGGSPQALPSPRDLLEATATLWPAPVFVDRLGALYLDRQARLAGLLRRPMGSGRAGMGNLALDEADGLSTIAVSMAAVYLRAGQIQRAGKALGALAGKPGDDPDLRQLVADAGSRRPGVQAYLALARRFLPKLDLLGGTSSDRLDPYAAHEVLRLGIARHPGDPDLLVLGSRVARLTSQPLLALRYLEEAQPALDRRKLTRDDRQAQMRELVDLAFTRLKLSMDPEDMSPAVREADRLRVRFEQARQRLGSAPRWLRDDVIDLELARGFVDAGLIDRAEPILEQASQQGSVGVEATLQLGNLLLKRGEAARAARLLQGGLERHRPDAAQETIGFVEEHSKLASALGGALEASGQQDEAKRAWKLSVRGWERLMVEHLRRKDMEESSEAFVEVGRLYYLLGRRDEGIQKFQEAIEQNESRDQSYIDPLAFLVEHGEVDAALEIFRRALARPSRVVSEYVKTYAALWVMDLTRRSGRTPEPAAEAYLRAIHGRSVMIRPPRASAWYVPLAGYAVGRRSYEDLAKLATNAGRRAELYFYEAMRRLADGRAEDAHKLWNQVLQTKMVSFFEFQMAARYLRVGAPTRPPSADEPATETI